MPREKTKLVFTRIKNNIPERSSRNKNFISFCVRGCKDDEAIGNAHLRGISFDQYERYIVCIKTELTF